MSETLTKLINSENILLGTLLPFLVVLTLVVFVHEMGHYLVGRWSGIGVKAFSIGFGPELIGFTDRRGTRWKVSAIPLGGYVKFAGDENGAGLADQSALDAMTPQERKSAFQSASVGRRAATVFAGPLANFLLTIVIFALFFGIFGRIVTFPVVTNILPGTAAERAGFAAGDVFQSVDGEKINEFNDLQRYVSKREGQRLVFEILRDGKPMTIAAAPEMHEIKDQLGNLIKVPILGIETSPQKSGYRVQTYSPLGALAESVKQTGYVAKETGAFLSRLVAGREDRCQLGGPVKIATMAGQAAKRGIDWLIQLAALLSAGIGLMNLLPIPPLDGGHLLLYAMEAARGRPVSQRAQEWVFRIGGIAVLSFMLFVFFNDLFGC